MARTLRPLLCLAAMLTCALPGLANSNTYGSTHRSSQSSFGKLLSPTTHTGSNSKNGLPRSTPRSAGPVARPMRSGQDRTLDQMMKQDVSLMGKASRDHGSSSTAKSYKPLSTEGSGQGSGINFSARSSQAKRRR